MIDNFENFYLDFSHKLRHGVGVACCKNSGEKICSCALSTYITDNSAIISAVATDTDCERNGMGESVVLACEKLLQGRDIYVLKSKNINNAFYEKLNYHFAGNWVCCKMQ